MSVKRDSSRGDRHQESNFYIVISEVEGRREKEEREHKYVRVVFNQLFQTKSIQIRAGSNNGSVFLHLSID